MNPIFHWTRIHRILLEVAAASVRRGHVFIHTLIWGWPCNMLCLTEDSRSCVVSGLDPGSRWPFPQPLAFNGAQDMVPQSMIPWHVEYFKLKECE